MEINIPNKEFWTNKKVLITGHTGFKGAWLSLLLHKLGANVYGYSLKPPTNPSLYDLAGIKEIVTSSIYDIRDYEMLYQVIEKIRPEIIIHMAAQSLVLDSYKNPIETYQINVMGTVNLFEAIRITPGIKAVVNVTTDKCYENKEWIWGYRENEPLGGYDPYSNSKSCSELITSSYRNSFFNPEKHYEHGVSLASARAGNVIGGGDWANNRLIPDILSSMMKGEKVKIRSPYAVRPWQHVLEPITGYLLLAERLYESGITYSEAWNFGPFDNESKPVEWIVKKLCEKWGNGASYDIDKNPQPHEATFLKLDCSKANKRLNWYPKWDIEQTLESIVEWTKLYLKGNDMRSVCMRQINQYFEV